MERVATGFVVAIAIAFGSVGATPAVAAGKCIKAGGWGTGAVEGFAKFMAEAAMKNQAKAWGGDNVKLDKAATSCKFAFPAFECNATARACK